jgi:serine/threonine protein kinase
VQPLSPTDPRTAGEYTLKARLGAGGMGRVYLGYSPGGRAVAVKVVHPELARDEEFLARFRNEVDAARMVSGMYTAPVVASGLNDHPPWLATVYVPGAPLDDVVSKNGPLPEGAVWRLAAGLAEALRAVHASGLVHRDLKPSNVLLADDGPHVIDFGISRAMGGSHLTATGVVVGTPGYMSPEQAEGHEAGAPSDIFSLACVLAFASTGKQPFGSGSAASVLYRVVATQPDLDGVPPQLRQVLEACLRKNPAERPQLSSLMVTFSSGAGAAADDRESPTSFWPRAVEDVIRTAVKGTPGNGATGSGAASPMSPPPGMTPGMTPGPMMQGPPSGFQSPPPGSPYSPPQGTGARPPGPYTGPYAGQQGAYTGHPGAYVGSSAQQPVYPQASGYQPPTYGQAVPPGPQTPPPAPQPQTWQTPAAQPQAAPWQAPGMQPQAPPQGAVPPWVGQPGMVQPGMGQPGFSQPGMGQPGFSQPGYPQGRRKPTRAEVPSGAMTAVWLMYAGAAVTALYAILGFPAYSHLSQIGTDSPVTVAQQNAYDASGIVLLFVILAGFLGVAGWLVCAFGVRRGRQWGAIVGSVLFGVDALVVLFVMVGAPGAPVPKAMSVVVWAIGLVATIFMWGREPRGFYRAFR